MNGQYRQETGDSNTAMLSVFIKHSLACPWRREKYLEMLDIFYQVKLLNTPPFICPQKVLYRLHLILLLLKDRNTEFIGMIHVCFPM